MCLCIALLDVLKLTRTTTTANGLDITLQMSLADVERPTSAVSDREAPEVIDVDLLDVESVVPIRYEPPTRRRRVSETGRSVSVGREVITINDSDDDDIEFVSARTVPRPRSESNTSVLIVLPEPFYEGAYFPLRLPRRSLRYHQFRRYLEGLYLCEEDHHLFPLPQGRLFPMPNLFLSKQTLDVCLGLPKTPRRLLLHLPLLRLTMSL